jgi:hypothetical protein
MAQSNQGFFAEELRQRRGGHGGLTMPRRRLRLEIEGRRFRLARLQNSHAISRAATQALGAANDAFS